MKRTIKDLAELKGKVVLCRVDFNVPIDDVGRILDATRIMNAIPTINYLSGQGAKVVLMSHLDRPKGYDIRKSLWPIAVLLMNKVKANVTFCNQVVGDEVKSRIAAMENGDVLLLENVRFYQGESECDMNFAKQIASLGQIFVNDAFGVAHRENASNYGVARLLPNAIGFLMEKEINALTSFMEEPKKPFIAVLGGAKVETKINILNKFVEKADTIIIGGAMAYTFLVAQNEDVGTSIVSKNNLDVARDILQKAQMAGKKILLPIDHLCIRDSDKKKKVLTVEQMIDDMKGYDIGPKTIELYSKEILTAGQIFWNGPMGLYEDNRFRKGTLQVARAIAKSSGYSLVGGGDTVAAVNSFKLGKNMNYISTGGGATMKFLEEGSLPAIDVIQEKIS